MRALFLVSLVLGLAACQSVARLVPDGFDAGPAGIEAYGRDSQLCVTAASEPLSYDLRLINATRYQRNRAFNRVYGRCMIQHGHRPRSYLRNVLPDFSGG